MNRRAVLLAAAFTLVTTGAFAQAQQDFSIVNRTGYQIDEIYVGPSSSPNWGRDLLGQNVLPNGRTFNVRFPQNVRECLFDIKVVYNDRDQAEFRQVNLCQVSRVNLFWDRARGTTRATTE